MSFFKWFKLNLLKGNVKKYHFHTSTNLEVSLNVDNFTIKNSKYEKLLDVKESSDD